MCHLLNKWWRLGYNMRIKKSELITIIREILEEKNWIKGAIKKPGALRKSMGVKDGEKNVKTKFQLS